MDGVRTAFGKAGPGGLFWKTRADDMAVKAVRELLRRNPEAPPDRIGDVVMAATAQVGDQGLTLGRDVALLAGLPHTVPGFAVDRMCAGALTAVTAERQALVANLCSCGIDDVTDPFRLDLRVPAEQFAHDLDGHVVGARLPEDPLRPRAAERGPHAVDEHDLPALHCRRVYAEVSSSSARRSSSCQQSAAIGLRWNWIRTRPPGDTSLPSRHALSSRR